MHPALSIVVFTVTSGLGFGWIALSLIFDLSGLAPLPDAASRTWSGVLAIALVTVGLVSSTLHLANPRNAWRAVVRVRTSWLSREAVLALAFYPIFIGYLLLASIDPTRAVVAALGWLSVLVSVITVFATSMIYACLRTIRQWRTPLTPFNFIAIAVALGALAHLAHLTVLGSPSADFVRAVSMLLVSVAFAGKLVYYLKIGLPPTRSLSAAVGFRMATVRLLDVGHTAGTFLTDEFDYRVSRAMLVVLKLLVLTIGFIVPLLIVARASEPSASLGALLLCFLGMLLERWLFFAEAQHVVRLYHGQSDA